jgi:hypothetical protein
MIAVSATAENPQVQIDFCRRSNLHAPLATIGAHDLRNGNNEFR